MVFLLSTRRFLIIAVHLALWVASVYLAFFLRFEYPFSAKVRLELGLWLPVLLAIRTGTFFAFRLYRGLWRYTGARDLIALMKAVTLSSLLLAAAMLLLGQRGFPRSIVVIEWLTCIIIVGGVRFAARSLRPQHQPVSDEDVEPVRVVIVGAGDAGEMLLRELQRKPGERRVIGFLDDDRHKLHEHIHGVKVLGGVDDLPAVVARRAVEEVLIAIPTATGAEMRRIVAYCKAAGARFKTIPGLDRLVDGRVTVNQLRNVAIEDLLGRDPVHLDMEALSEEMEGHVVMVSGAGGSIGSEICRQVCRFRPAALLLVERAENNLFHVHRELLDRFPGLPLHPLVADIGDPARMEELFAAHRPSVLFHAAAHKHVPMMEWNPGEAVKNNVLGTRALADLADRFGVERFVMISTDKAVNPTSIMGASKRVAEMYVQALSQRSPTKFVTVRFGNVLGSAGSVIPIFQEQIANGGPVTVTHPEMKRYFMTIPEASQLVLQAGVMGNGGEIFILDMGKPVSIAELARDLITLSGLEPGADVEIRFTGIRPGEKLFEEIAVDAERASKTGHPRIFVGHFRPQPWEALQQDLADLAGLAGGEPEAIRRKLGEMIPEYRPYRPAAREDTQASGDRRVSGA